MYFEVFRGELSRNSLKYHFSIENIKDEATMSKF